MKTTVFPHMAAILILCTITPVIAQNSTGKLRPFHASKVADAKNASATHGPSDAKSLLCRTAPKHREVAAVSKVQGNLLDSKPAYSTPSPFTLEPLRISNRQNAKPVADSSLLRIPSAYQRLATKTDSLQPYEIEENSLQKGLARISAMYRKSCKR